MIPLTKEQCINVLVSALNAVLQDPNSDQLNPCLISYIEGAIIEYKKAVEVSKQ